MGDCGDMPDPKFDNCQFEDCVVDALHTITISEREQCQQHEQSCNNSNISNGHFEALDELDLSSSNLVILADTDLNVRLSTLILDFNELPDLPESIGSSVPNLRILSVNGNQLKTLPTAVGNLKDLEELYLNENLLQCLPDSVCDLKKLRVLRLTGNCVEKLPSSFGELPSLENLTIDENKLSVLPKTFGLLEKLEVLEANDNCLKSLTAGFGRLKNLRIVNLCNNKIECLPEKFGDLKNVEFLDLSSNQIEHLPTYFNSCHSLKKLYVDSNGIGVLPDWISALPQLVEFSAKDNKLSYQSVSEQFGQTNHKLKSLDLGGNFMTKLPDSLGELTELESICLGSVIDELERRNFQNGNWLSRLPSSFSRLVRLRHLRLDENQLTDLPADFGCLSCLEYLDLGQNMLHELPDSFGSLKSLKVCLLSKNHLQLLPSTFGNLSSLEDLRIDNNLIAELPESFEKLVQLKTLDMFNNKLMSVPSCLQHFKNLVRLDILENNLGLPIQEIPMVMTQSKYPPRDPALKDNWRGRARQDLSQLESTIIQVADTEDAPEEEEEEDWQRFSSQQLELAARRNMSLWKSHDGPDSREKFTRGNNAFEDWLVQSKAAGKLNGDAHVEKVRNADDKEGDGDEDDDDDSYTMSFSSKNCDWGSASEGGDNSDCQMESNWDDTSAIPCEENWDEELEDQFSSVQGSDPVPASQHPTWAEAYKPTPDLDTLFFAFDLHPDSVPRNLKDLNLPVEDGQFEDIED